MERERRAYLVHVTAVSAIIALTREPPMIPAMAIARMTPGKEIIISAIRMMTISTMPPKYPEMMPIVVPTTKMQATRAMTEVRE